jgi:hypothetical protein
MYIHLFFKGLITDTSFSVFYRLFAMTDVPHWSPEAMTSHFSGPFISSECNSTIWKQILMSSAYLFKFPRTIYIDCCM